MEIAVQDDYVLGGGGRLAAERAYELARGMHVGVVRVNVLSSEVASRGWGRLDALVDRIRAEGMIPQVTIMGRPRWYTGNPKPEDNLPDGGCPHIDPNPAKFAQWCTRVVEHFGSRVGRYALWNEPNHPTFLVSTKGSSAALYARLYHAGLRAVRAASPKAVVLWGEIAGGKYSRRWVKEALLEGYRLNGGKPVIASGFAIHPYQHLVHPAKASPTKDEALRFGDLPYLKQYLSSTRAMRTTLNRPVPIYVTEFGWFNPPSKLSTSDETRAEWAKVVVARGRSLGLAQFLYFTLVESPGRYANGNLVWDTGIVRRDGSTSLTYDAFAVALR